MAVTVLGNILSCGNRLASYGYAVVGIDNEGHGRSMGARCYIKKFDNIVDDCINFFKSICGIAFLKASSPVGYCAVDGERGIQRLVVEHPNLVKLVGYCAVDGERGIQRLLVYEYMPNKSLGDHMFNKACVALSWEKRLKIVLGAAQGLAYLHEELEVQVIYRDFKSSNVLLDEDYNPKLSDFGLAQEGPTEGNTHVSTAVMGTHGYAAPDYIETGHLTSKSDVWSFGVVLYEILTGRQSFERNHISIIKELRFNQGA